MGEKLVAVVIGSGADAAVNLLHTDVPFHAPRSKRGCYLPSVSPA
jgi:hypothetical protein